MEISISVVNYHNSEDAKDLAYLLNEYAKDPMGGGKALSSKVQENLVKELSKLSHATSVIAHVDQQPAGLINFFDAFSTFKCQPLINIHDIVVIDEYRRLGLSQMMLGEVEKIARQRGCCKITLEVLTGNLAAQKSYQKFGFGGYELDPKMGKAMFWQKDL